MKGYLSQKSKKKLGPEESIFKMSFMPKENFWFSFFLQASIELWKRKIDSSHYEPESNIVSFIPLFLLPDWVEKLFPHNSLWKLTLRLWNKYFEPPISSITLYSCYSLRCESSKRRPFRIPPTDAKMAWHEEKIPETFSSIFCPTSRNPPFRCKFAKCPFLFVQGSPLLGGLFSPLAKPLTDIISRYVCAFFSARLKRTKRTELKVKLPHR